MQSVGQEARAASRLVAKADTAARNQALTTMSAWIRTVDEQDGFGQVVLQCAARGGKNAGCVAEACEE